MTKVYPNATATSAATGSGSPDPGSEPEGVGDHQLGKSSSVVLTVWKKSLLFNCDGFTVYDTKGNLVFRVDNYIAGSKSEIVLMDGSGKPLLTIRRKKLSLADNWLVFEGEAVNNPLYSVRKHVNLLNTKFLAYVSSGCGNGNGSGSSSASPKKNHVLYAIEGSYKQRLCAVYDEKRRKVAEIRRKEAVGGLAFGTDVFRLIVVEPEEMDSAVAMALVILLDQMFGSSSSGRLSIL